MVEINRIAKIDLQNRLGNSYSRNRTFTVNRIWHKILTHDSGVSTRIICHSRVSSTPLWTGCASGKTATTTRRQPPPKLWSWKRPRLLKSSTPSSVSTSQKIQINCSQIQNKMLPRFAFSKKSYIDFTIHTLQFY